MTVNHDPPGKFEALRQQAEELLRRAPEPACDTPSDIIELIHELRIHQAELSVQNEELKRAQEELSNLQREYEDLFEFAPCGYLTLNAAGIITRANLTAVSLLDTHRRQVLRAGLSQFIEADCGDAYLAARQAAATTGEKQSIDMPLKRKNAPPVWVSAAIKADLDGSGVATQWRVELMDITVQRKAETEKSRLREQLQQAQKMETIGTLAGGIAHEFNNILSIIIGNNELVKDDLPEWSHTREYTEEIRKAGLRARDVVRQLLTFSRQDAARREPIDMDSVVKDSLSLIRSSFPRNIDIEATIGEDVGTIVGNATQINQLLINLCANAVDALPSEKGVISIDVCNETIGDNATLRPRQPPGRYVRLTVRDNGSGMDAETRDRIFEPYFTTKDIGKGTGIGLSVVHGIVERHHGTISVDSAPGEGSAFTMLFPARGSAVAKTPKAEEPLPTGSERILFVDDEAAILKLSTRRLENLGYTVDGHTDPQAALKRFKAHPEAYDLIITDMAMPKMTGANLIAEVLKIRPDVPTMICTGYSEKISKEKAAKIGIRSFAMKPLDRTNFAETVRKVLDEARKETQ